MNDREYERWGQVRRKGRLRFALLRGAVSFGVVIAVLMIGVGNSSFMNSLVSVKTLWYVLVGLVAGFVWGLTVWRIQESMYRQQGQNNWSFNEVEHSAQERWYFWSNGSDN